VEGERRIPSLKGVGLRIKRLAVKPLRLALLRYVRARPDGPIDPTARPKVWILLVSPWGMGGTIRAALNLAGYLAEHGWDVEVVGAYRRREESFFGEMPAGATFTALDDQRPGRAPGGLAGRVRKFLRKRESVLVHPSDGTAHEFTLWHDIQLARRLRGQTGILMGTRPGLNLLAADLAVPGMVTVGLEQMHFRHHVKPLRDAMKRRYKKLDGFVVLTEHDLANYSFLDGDVAMTRIENTARELPGPKADLSSKRVLAAGRLRAQKGFDLLIPAWAKVAKAHPDWKLRICGEGRQRPVLEQLVSEHGLQDVVEMPGGRDMAEEMAAASVFAMSSRFEGFPLILLEAMSKGMAVVSFDCPTGPADIIDDHRNGLIVPPKDIDALADALSEMMGDEELRRRCAGPAMATARDYTMEAIGPRWVEYLSGLWRSAAPAHGRTGAP
jgi:glycosyltransferase involved in cell wall biosynthesis